MSEYIKKEDATKALSDHFMYLQRLKHDEGNGCKKYEQAGINWCLNTLNELPTYSFPDREKGEWIPVSERLPETHQDILLELRSGEMLTGFKAETEPYFYCHGADGCYIEPQNVLAWQPLPEPYKKGGE